MNAAAPRKFGMGAAVRRKEDRAFITGGGSYLDDRTPAGALSAYVVRSAMAHARFRLGGVEAAREMAGVHLVMTHGELGGVGGLPNKDKETQPDGSQLKKPPRPLLADGVVRFVGDPIAFVVAEDIETAKLAAEAIEIDYDPLPAVVDMAAAADGTERPVWPQFGTNVAFEHHRGDRAATDEVFRSAARITRIRVVNNRVVANFMETRGIIAEFGREPGRYSLTISTQGGHIIRDVLAKDILRIPVKNIRVVTPDVGGGFGTKIFVYAEYPLAAMAARRLGRPVKWVAERGEHFLGDSHGRDNVASAEMAMDENGAFKAMRIDVLANIGAYLSQFAVGVPVSGVSMGTGVYAIPHFFGRLRGIYTNTQPVDAYRGAGRPEAAYLVERLVDACGRETGLGPVEIRRRNFIRPEMLPYETHGGRVFDSGEFEGQMMRALEAADQAGFAARRAASEAAGKIRGFGFGTYIEACAFPGNEPATLTLNDDGTVTLLIGTQSNGQGHATAYAQFIVGQLGIDYDKIEVVQGDTDRVKDGEGTMGSRSVPLGAVSVDRAATKLARQLRERASRFLEAEADDLEFADGTIRVRRTNRGITLAELARNAIDRTVLTAYDDSYDQPEPTYPNGTHVAEVEIDPKTGLTEIVRYQVVDDFGATVNPLLLEGQVHGGIAQGIGQALFERTVFDDDGQLLTASFLDYALPRADDIPPIAFETRNVPCKTNAFGMKGAGEAGAIGSCPAVINAVIDALNDKYGITTIDMPATPERVWQAIQAAK